jgi:hypothetical protein
MYEGGPRRRVPTSEWEEHSKKLERELRKAKRRILVLESETTRQDGDIQAHVVTEDHRYPLLCINGKFNYGLSIDPQDGTIETERKCICSSREASECVCDVP